MLSTEGRYFHFLFIINKVRVSDSQLQHPYSQILVEKPPPPPLQGVLHSSLTPARHREDTGDELVLLRKKKVCLILIWAKKVIKSHYFCRISRLFFLGLQISFVTSWQVCCSLYFAPWRSQAVPCFVSYIISLRMNVSLLTVFRKLNWQKGQILLM